MFAPDSRRLRGAAALAAAAVLAAAGCSTTIWPSRAPAPDAVDTPYQRDARTSSLEVPPDLSRSRIQDAYPVPGAKPRDTVLPAVEGMRIESEGRLRWLAAEASNPTSSGRPSATSGGGRASRSRSTTRGSG